jgi:hypothetical protein
VPANGASETVAGSRRAHLVEIELVRDNGVELGGERQQPVSLLGGVGCGRLQLVGQFGERLVTALDLDLRDGTERHLVQIDVHLKGGRWGKID